MTIFKAYDIRGKYPKELDEVIAGKIAKAFCRLFSPKKVVVARDMRLSSKSISDEVLDAIVKQGAVAVNAGCISTPMFYFAVNKLDADAGIMITASHNPKDYNGLKLVGKEARPINYDNGINKIEQMINDDFCDSKEKGELIEIDVFNDYFDYIKNYIKPVKKLKVVLDYGNGMSSVTTKNLLRVLGVDAINLYDSLDGNFPNHEANPLKPENTLSLQKRVIEERADLGVAFDGDGDRMLIVDDLGERIEGDVSTAIIAKQLLSKGREKIMYDLRSTKAVSEIIMENGGEPIISRVGHSFIKEKMREENVAFAGEISGHYYFRDNFFTESTDIPLIMILELLTNSNKKLSQIKKDIIRYSHSGEINKEVSDREAIFERLKKKYSSLELLELDGLTFSGKDYWFNVRGSNTEPLVRVNLEAKSRELMAQKLSEVFELIY